MAKKSNPSPILVPVDFSEHSEAALGFAIQMADLLHAPVVVLHVVHDPGEAPGFYAGKSGDAGDGAPMRLQDVAAGMMEKFIDKIREKYPHSRAVRDIATKLRTGLPVAQILDVAEKTGARMVVMGSLGRTGLKHVLIGSKAEQVVRLCPVPVTIVKRTDSE